MPLLYLSGVTATVLAGYIDFSFCPLFVMMARTSTSVSIVDRLVVTPLYGNLGAEILESQRWRTRQVTNSAPLAQALIDTA